MELVNPSLLDQTWKKNPCCSSLLRRLVKLTCLQCKVQELVMGGLFCRMHSPFREALFEMEARCYREVTGITLGRDQIENWSATEHKLCLLRLAYSAMRGSSEAVLGLNDIQKHLDCIDELMQNGNAQKVKWGQLVFKSGAVSVDALHKSMLHYLRNVDVTSQSSSEHFQMLWARCLLQRCIPSEFPLGIIPLVENISDDASAVLYDLRCLLENGETTQASVTKVMRVLTPSEARLIKFCLLYYKKMCQFTIRYANEDTAAMKCTAYGKETEDAFFVLCLYCNELLTYRNISKRPPSFGPYLNSEMLEMRCFKCDSTDLVMIPCGDVEKGVLLELGHPDRHAVSFCRGRRSCLKISGYPSRVCTECQASLAGQGDNLEKFHHSGTCLDSSKESGDYCLSCKYFWMKDSKLTERLKKKQCSPKLEPIQTKAISIEGSTNSRKRFRFACEKAMRIKQRKTLTK